jgi:hypothetical protein
MRKNGGVKLYMPCWERDELLAIGTYIRNNDMSFSEDNKELLSEKNIRDRFQKFGGYFSSRNLVWLARNLRTRPLRNGFSDQI